MNIRNWFHRAPQQTDDSTPTVPDVMRIVVATPIPENDEATQDDDNTAPQSDQLHVPDQDEHNTPTVVPWIVRDAETFSLEQQLMSERWPDFRLEVIDDPSSPYHGSTCWSGKLKPGIYEDIEWEILAIYQGIGGGCGDWSGVITIYFINPTSEQIVETLGYTPKCMQQDNEGTLILNNIRPLRLTSLDAACAIQHAYTVCRTIEQMCIGQISEDTPIGYSVLT